ncbi:hypothetical protein [Bathymodiolus platifrons methanotrophic gill symbiont]|uniref:hypothetical protein n=1 Tax=Bathymodiolus platifrons methanotrophic gill symbiont TaxID=113268 RepID=UPI001C8F0353|nr:hypothetical protein [Bathymodiolus platifrons methanotrophic gill symbiont]
MGDALNALRPQRLRTKVASSLLPHWLDGYSECNSLPPSRAASALRIGELPCRLPRFFSSLRLLRFPDFQRKNRNHVLIPYAKKHIIPCFSEHTSLAIGCA